jgi:hypothetical protein
MKILICSLFVTFVLAGAVWASEPGTGNWPMWGGTADRNMVSGMKGLPTDWDIKTKKNIKWVAKLGSQSYGNPVVSGGVVLVGTNNELLRDPQQGGDRGVLMAFRETDGEFLWQQTHVKLESGRANDWPFQGIASSPLIEGEKLYYVSNRIAAWSSVSTSTVFVTIRMMGRSRTKDSPDRTMRTLYGRST